MSDRPARKPPFDVKLSLAAHNAVVACLGVRAAERCTLIVERGMEALGGCFREAFEEVGCELRSFRLSPSECERPEIINEVMARLTVSDASLLICKPEGMPAAFRRRVCADTGDRRHGHMPGLTKGMMHQSMLADYREVERLGERLIGELRLGGTLSVRTLRGTDLSVDIGKRHRWYNEGGILRRGGWMNLPAGELITAPESVSGVLVPDGGAFDEDAHPLPASPRMKMHFEDGSLARVEGPQADVTRYLSMLDAAANGRRVGQVAFGTNIGVLAHVGTLLQDLKLPGFHLTLGHPAGELTDAAWESPIECPILIRKPDVDFEGMPILRGGKYVDRLRD